MTVAIECAGVPIICAGDNIKGIVAYRFPEFEVAAVIVEVAFGGENILIHHNVGSQYGIDIGGATINQFDEPIKLSGVFYGIVIHIAAVQTKRVGLICRMDKERSDDIQAAVGAHTKGICDAVVTFSWNCVESDKIAATLACGIPIALVVARGYKGCGVVGVTKSREHKRITDKNRVANRAANHRITRTGRSTSGCHIISADIVASNVCDFIATVNVCVVAAI